jgi:hypothetical protein
LSIDSTGAGFSFNVETFFIIGIVLPVKIDLSVGNNGGGQAGRSGRNGDGAGAGGDIGFPGVIRIARRVISSDPIIVDCLASKTSIPITG